MFSYRKWVKWKEMHTHTHTRDWLLLWACINPSDTLLLQHTVLIVNEPNHFWGPDKSKSCGHSFFKLWSSHHQFLLNAPSVSAVHNGLLRGFSLLTAACWKQSLSLRQTINIKAVGHKKIKLKETEKLWRAAKSSVNNQWYLHWVSLWTS